MDNIVSGDRKKEKEKEPEEAEKTEKFRPPLPVGNIFQKVIATPLKCGSTHDIAVKGHKFFKLNSKNKPCYHAFLGSRTANCRVGVLCDGKLQLGKQGEEGCTGGYLKISDGTEGLMAGCGGFTFKKTPRYARNNGTDLYLYYMGVTSNPCVALCIEDVDSEQDLKRPKQITPNKQFVGFPLQPDCTCGRRLNVGRIVGGDDAMRFEFPWIGAVTFKNSKYARMPFCGGALINDKYFVSAAHCFAPDDVEGDDIQVLLHAHVMDRRSKKGLSPRDPRLKSIPGWDLPKETDESEESVRVDVEEIINHPLFNEKNYDWDVAVLRLKKRINLGTSNVLPVCLPLISELFNYNDGDIHVVAGWGRSSEKAPVGSRVLQKLDVPFANRDICKYQTVPTIRHLCAGFLEGDKDACTGDSGGPLIYKFKTATNQYLLSGIVSAGEGCARKGKLGLYTNTLEVIQWIYHHTADGTWCNR